MCFPNTDLVAHLLVNKYNYREIEGFFFPLSVSKNLSETNFRLKRYEKSTVITFS